MVKVLIAYFGWGQNKTDSFAIALQPLYRISHSFSAQNKQHPARRKLARSKNRFLQMASEKNGPPSEPSVFTSGGNGFC